MIEPADLPDTSSPARAAVATFARGRTDRAGSHCADLELHPLILQTLLEVDSPLGHCLVVGDLGIACELRRCEQVVGNDLEALVVSQGQLHSRSFA